jgi:DNA-binding GntR family transcriptional regulator
MVMPRTTRTVARVQHSSIADKVTDTLRTMIVRGEFAPNERVTQEHLAEMLGVSTMPVREALLRLVAEGMVETSANRSFSIISLTVDDISSLYWVHGVLEGELAYRACKRQTPELLERLGELAVEHRQASTPETRFQSNWEFYRELHHASGAPRIAVLLRNALRFLPLTEEVSGWSDLAVSWQSQLILALKAGDADRARRVSEEHAQLAGELWVEHALTHGYLERELSDGDGVPAAG